MLPQLFVVIAGHSGLRAERVERGPNLLQQKLALLRGHPAVASSLAIPGWEDRQHSPRRVLETPHNLGGCSHTWGLSAEVGVQVDPSIKHRLRGVLVPGCACVAPAHGGHVSAVQPNGTGPADGAYSERGSAYALGQGARAPYSGSVIPIPPPYPCHPGPSGAFGRPICQGRYGGGGKGRGPNVGGYGYTFSGAGTCGVSRAAGGTFHGAGRLAGEENAGTARSGLRMSASGTSSGDGVRGATAAPTSSLRAFGGGGGMSSSACLFNRSCSLTANTHRGSR